MKQAEFEIKYVWHALAFAIFAGFALGAHVIALISFDFPLGPTFYAYVQTHGHVQLSGWIGLFIVGISLHILPRLTGTPLTTPRRPRQILYLLSSGLALRFAAHAVLPYLSSGGWFTFVGLLTIVSGGLEWIAAVCYIGTIFQTLQHGMAAKRRPAEVNIKPLLGMMMFGWFVYFSLNLVLLVTMVVSRTSVLNQAWSELALKVFVLLVLLPVVFAFSLRMFPLYLRLPVIDWSVPRFAAVYGAAAALYLLAIFTPLLRFPAPARLQIVAFAVLLKTWTVFWFVLKLDLFTRRRLPWTVNRTAHPKDDRKPTRKSMPDYGEFGRFEWLIYGAYAWLLFGCSLEALIHLAAVFDWDIVISGDAIRHCYVLGFISQIIPGMAVRMIPGFTKKRAIRHPGLVAGTFWLINAAAVSRIMPLIIPPALLAGHPVIVNMVQAILGFSGLWGLAAVVCLWINLRRTVGHIAGTSPLRPPSSSSAA